MKRILVPLDGSELSKSILPDARRLAGPDGTLILVHDVLGSAYEPDTMCENVEVAIEHSEQYLRDIAEELRAQGASVEVETLFIADTAFAIDEAARIFKADMIACATHGRSPFGRLLRGSVAWRAVANSSVPVLLRHVDDAAETRFAALRIPRILVPLDGSKYSETAVPIAADLAKQWRAKLFLMQVIPDVISSGNPFGTYSGMPYNLETEVRDARNHLCDIGQMLGVPAHEIVATGGVIDQLKKAVAECDISHVVLTTHGRTGLPRILLGSVADELVHKLHCPVIIVPALAAVKIGEHVSKPVLADSVSTA